MEAKEIEKLESAVNNSNFPAHVYHKFNVSHTHIENEATRIANKIDKRRAKEKNRRKQAKGKQK